MCARSQTDEFTSMERRIAFENNSVLLTDQFRDTPAFKSVPHYICESCGFVSKNKADFNIDHVFPVAQGGSRNRVGKSVNQQLHDAHRHGASDADIDTPFNCSFRLATTLRCSVRNATIAKAIFSSCPTIADTPTLAIPTI